MPMIDVFMTATLSMTAYLVEFFTKIHPAVFLPVVERHVPVLCSDWIQFQTLHADSCKS